MGKKIVLHIGYPKTATTTLQQYVFPRHSEIFYLGKPFVDTVVMDGINSIFFASDRVFEANCHGIGEKISAMVPEDKVGVLSFEGFTAFERYETTDGLRTIIKRVQKLFESFDEVTILVSIRKQRDIVPSYFNEKQYKNLFFSSNFEKFFAKCIKQPSKNFLASFFYHRVLNEYANIFGRDAIKIIPFEELLRDRKVYSEKLAASLGVSGTETFELIADNHSNKKEKNPNGYKTKKHFNLYEMMMKIRVKYLSLPPDFHFFDYWWGRMLINLFSKVDFIVATQRAIVLTDANKETIDTLYMEDNAKLAETYGVDLRQYDYPVKTD